MEGEHLKTPSKATNTINPNLMRNYAGVIGDSFNRFITPCRILGKPKLFNFTN